jgi:hypothetical protein
VASQLLTVISPLRPFGTDGQTVTVALHPEGLGSVNATVSLSDGQLVVRLAATTQAGQAALQASLSELKSGLSETNPTATVLLSNSGGHTSADSGGHNTDTNTRPFTPGNSSLSTTSDTRSTASQETAVSSAMTSSNSLDLRL